MDELTDQYVRDELTADERERVEKHFLNTPQRRQKLEFATELLSHTEAERGEPVETATVQPVVERRPGLLELFLAFWRKPSFAHAALTAASLIVVVSVTFVLLRSGSSPEYAEVTVPLSTSTRAEGPSPPRVKRPDSGLRINLSAPQDTRDAKGFRARLLDENGVERDLTIDKWNDQTIAVLVPATLLTRGSYAIQLSKVKDDGTEERVRGSYYFVVE